MGASSKVKVKFALFIPQAGMSFKDLCTKAEWAERFGYHSLWLVDHLWSPRLPDLGHPECLTALSALAARTSELRLGTLVLCNGFRNPALLAKSLTTIDHVSQGRLEVGLGAGWFEPEFRGYGYDFPPTGVRLKQLEESLRILKAMFTEPKVSFQGNYYALENAVNNPKPLQKPHPPITIGGSGERVMLRLVAQYADRWNCPAGYDNFERKLAALREHCQAAGRAPDSIEISEQLLVCIGKSAAEVDGKWQSARMLRPFSKTGIKGTPSQIIDALRGRVAMGITTFVILFSDFAAETTLGLFAREVAPAFN